MRRRCPRQKKGPGSFFGAGRTIASREKGARPLFLARALGVALLFLGTQAVVRAHDVPEEIDIQSYVTVQGSNLQVVLRVPLLAITDTNLPKDGTGYLAMPYLDPALGEAANQISTGILFLENDERLQQFGVASARISLPSDKSFAVAHTITLTLAGLGFMPSGPWFAVCISMLIALSIVYVAIEDALGANLRRRWMVAFGFGLVHGFGFAFAFGDALQFAGSHAVAALLSFNTGLELGLIIILAITLPAVGL